MTKQFETYFDSLENTKTTTPLIATVNKNSKLRENYDSYYDDSYEDSLENEDLSILDSDLLLNLQLNTFSTDANNLKLNAKLISPSQDSPHHQPEHINGSDEEENEEASGHMSDTSAVSNQNRLKSVATTHVRLLPREHFLSMLCFVYFYFFH